MLRFIDGFDHYPIGDLTLKWNSQNNASAMSTATTRFSSGQSLQFGTGGTGFILKTLDAQGTWILGAAFRWTSFSAAGAIFQVKSGTNQVGSLNLSIGGKLSIVSTNSGGGSSTTLATGTTTLFLNTWYYIEFIYSCNTTSGSVAASCLISGVAECTQAAGGSGGTATNGTTADTVVALNSTNNQLNIDDFYACDGTGSANNAPLGDVRVETLYPGGAGYNTDFAHTGASTNWQATSEATENGDTSYVSSATAGNIDSYTMTDLSSTPASIFGVQAVMVARKDDAGARVVDQLTRIAGTNYLGPDVSLPASYGHITRLMEASPATSTAWTATEVNGVEMGVKLVS